MLASPQCHHQSPVFNPYTYYGSMYGRQPPPLADMGGDFFRENIRELAQQRARKAQWLPDEVDDSDEESEYTHHGPRDRRYFEALKTQQNMGRMRNEYEARAMAMQEDAQRLRQAEEERAWELQRRQMENQDARQRAVEQMIREASEMRAAALQQEANLRGDHPRNQHMRNPSTTGRNPSRRRPFNSASVPINVQGTPPSAHSSVPPRGNPIPEPRSHSPPKRLYTENHETAASVIQQKFRIHRSLLTVSSIASEFQTLKTSFEYPGVFDFQKPGPEEGHISVHTTRSPSEFDKIEEAVGDEESLMEVDGPQPKLAFSPVNYPIHLYVDAMEKLLMRLDGVESWGDKGVRERRRSVVREIGEESAKLERYWKQAWMDYAEKQKEGARKEEGQLEVQAEQQEKMEIDEELVHVEHPKVEDNDEWLDVAELAPDVSNDGQIEIEDRARLSPSLTITSTGSTPTLDDEFEIREL